MIRLIVLSLVIAPFAIGCSSGEAAPSAGSGTPTGGSTVAEMGKCEQCGKEVAKTALHNHGGKMVCAECDSH